MDVDNAFTLSELNEDVWIIIPKEVMSIPEVAQLFADEFGLDYDKIFGKELIAKTTPSDLWIEAIQSNV